MKWGRLCAVVNELATHQRLETAAAPELQEGLQVIEAGAIWGNTSRPKYSPAMALHVSGRTRTGQLQYSGNSKCERHFIPHTVNYISQTLSAERCRLKST